MNVESVFFDTNVLIYAVALDDARGPRAEGLLAAGGMVSVQVLNEFVSVARRKLRMSWKEVIEALEAVRTLCAPVVPLTIETHVAALRIAQQYKFGIYDALIIAVALDAKCATLYSEDLQDGQLIDGVLRIRNPFK